MHRSLRILAAAALLTVAPRFAQSQPRADVPSGTAVTVRLDSRLSTEHAGRGEEWTGTVVRPVMVGRHVEIPAGSPVRGVVTDAAEGTHHSHAHLSLALREVRVRGESRELHSSRETIVAGSHRAKKIGAIAVGTAAGAILGHAVAEHGHGALIGGVLGGAAGYGLTRNAFRTLELKRGTEITFMTSDRMVAARR